MLGRRREVAVQILQVVDAAREGRGGAVLVEAEAGMGKTELLRSLTANRPGADIDVISIVGSEAEQAMPLAGITQLCAPLVDHIVAIAEHQGDLVRGALGLLPSSPGIAGGHDVMALGLALVSLLAESSRERALVVAVDDAHWLDASSIQVLDFVGRRLSGTSVALIAAQRPEADRLRMPHTIELAPLSMEESVALLIELGAAPAVASTIASRSVGLPLLLRRIVEGLDQAQRSGLAPLPDPLPVGADLEAGYAATIAGLPPDQRTALLVLAALGEHHPKDDIEPLRRTDLEPAERAGLLRIDAQGARFVHPIARSAAYWSASPADRRSAHLTIADQLSPADPVEIWHRSAAATGADDALAARLIDLGRDAERRGASASAVVAFQRAAELAETDVVRVRALLDGARAALASGATKPAGLMIDRASAAGADPAEVLEMRARFAVGAGSPAVARRLFDELAERRRHVDRAGADAATLDGAMLSLRMYDIGAASRALASIDGVGDPRIGRRVDVLRAIVAARQHGGSRACNVTQMLGRVRDMDQGGDDLRFLCDAVTLAMGWAGSDPALVAMADDMLRRHSEAIPGMVPALLVAQAVHRSRSDLAGAAAAAEQAVELATEAGLVGVRALALPWLASAQAGLGHPSTPATCALVEGAGGDLAWVSARVSMGLFHLTNERFDAARSTLVALHEWSAGSPRTGMHWQADLAEAALRAGDRSLAEEQCAILEAVAGSSGSPWLVAAHERVRAQLTDDLDLAIARFSSAVERFRTNDFPIAAARAGLMLGERLRRGRRRAAARDALIDARRDLDRAGMTMWVDRCDRELVAAGAGVANERHDGVPTRRAAHAVLTPQELQVARWVVEGESNREIAGRLFLSPRTVEAHLSTVYRKMSVRGRGELSALGRQDPSLA